MSAEDAAGKGKKKAEAIDPSAGIQALLVVEIVMRMFIWGGAMALSVVLMARSAGVRSITWGSVQSIGGAVHLTWELIAFIVIFNVAYLLILAGVRAVIPRPKRGIYKLAGELDINLFYSGLSGILTKARYQAPFPAILIQQMGNIQPFRWLLGLRIGPHTQTSFFLDPTLMDPWAITIGKNVNIGFGTTITAHLQEFDYVMVDPVVIEDNVMIGAHSAIACGVHIKRGAFVEPFAVVRPGEVIGEGELWAGRPAKKKGYYRFTPTAEANGEKRAEADGNGARNGGEAAAAGGNGREQRVG